MKIPSIINRYKNNTLNDCHKTAFQPFSFRAICLRHNIENEITAQSIRRIVCVAAWPNGTGAMICQMEKPNSDSMVQRIQKRYFCPMVWRERYGRRRAVWNTKHRQAVRPITPPPYCSHLKIGRNNTVCCSTGKCCTNQPVEWVNASRNRWVAMPNKALGMKRAALILWESTFSDGL